MAITTKDQVHDYIEKARRLDYLRREISGVQTKKETKSSYMDVDLSILSKDAQTRIRNLVQDELQARYFELEDELKEMLS